MRPATALSTGSWWSELPRQGLLLIAYVASGWLGLQLSLVGDHISLFWPPSAIALVALLRWGDRSFATVWLAAFSVALLLQAPPLLAAGIACGNSLGPWLAARLLRRLQLQTTLHRPRDLALFLLLGVLGGTLISAANGMLQLHWHGRLGAVDPLWAGLMWWLGDALGVLVFGIPLLLFDRRDLCQRLQGRRRWELLAVGAGALFCAGVVFQLERGGEWPATVLFLPLLMQLWLALRGGLWLASAAGMLIALVAMFGLLGGVGPFDPADPLAGLGLIGSYIVAAQLMSAVLSVLNQQLQRTEARWRTALEGSQQGVWSLDIGQQLLELDAYFVRLMGYPPSMVGPQLQDWLPFLHPDDRPSVQQAVVAHLRGEDPRFAAELRLRCADGSWRWLFIQGQVLERDAGGRPLRTTGTYADRSRTREAEREVQRLRDFYAQILDTVRTGVWVSDRQGVILYANRGVAEMAGLSPAEIVGRDVLREFPEPVIGHFRPYMERVLQQHAAMRFEAMPMHTPGGRDVLLSGWVLPWFKDGQFDGVICTSDEITEAVRAQLELRQAASVYQVSREAIIIAGPDGIIRQVNPAFSAISGYTSEDVVGRGARMLQSGHQGRPFYRAMWEAVRRDGYWQGELVNRRKNGELYTARMTLSAVHDSQGELVNYVAVSDDISLQKANEARIQHMAYFDPLTDLPNRAQLALEAERLFAQTQASDQQVAMLFVDLDHFKNVNDSLGHASGDRLLQALAARLNAGLTPQCVVGRLGGDEFLLLRPIEAEFDLPAFAQRVLNLTAEPLELDGRRLTITPSIGVSLYPRDGADFGELLKAADTALYRAKDRGRNLYHFFTAEMNASAQERLTLENDLRTALQGGQFLLHYQPQYTLQAGTLCGVEALLRWQHPQRGLIAPALFIPIAEQSGLIASIGLWVLREACRQARSWQQAGLAALRVSVNLSARQLEVGDLAAEVQAALLDAGLEAQWLELELTESLLAQNVEETRQVLQRIHALGVELAIDDFGTGYSSLSYLKRFPIGRLKIDQSFVRDLLEDSDDRAIARSIVTLGHSLGMQVVAEGVENVEQLEQLRQFGADVGQGYYLGRPQTAAAMAGLLAQASLPSAGG